MTWVDHVPSPPDGDSVIDSGIELSNWIGPGSTEYDVPETIIPGDAARDDFTLSVGTYPDFLYVGYWTPFDSITLDIDTANATTATLAAQYLKFTPDGDGLMTWASISITDNTASSGKTLAVDGTITWTLPTDWGPSIHAGRERYWIRFHPSVTIDTVSLDDLTLHIRGADTDDVDTIMTDYAPSPWAIDTGTYYDSTTGGTYFERFHGVSLFAALYEIAARAGEHFRYKDDRKIEWLRADVIDSGLVASTWGEPAAGRLVIPNGGVSVQEDSTEYITRLYIEGAGAGTVAIDLVLATDTHSGYSYSTTENYVALNPEPTPVISDYMKFSDIVSQSGRKTETASNELLAAGVAELARRSADFTTYRLDVSGIQDAINVGEWLRVMYHGASKNGVYVDIDTSLYIHTIDWKYTPGEGLSASLGVSNADRKPESNFTFLQRKFSQAAHASNVPQPIQFENTLMRYGIVKRTAP